jgi:hypothetical protein
VAYIGRIIPEFFGVDSTALDDDTTASDQHIDAMIQLARAHALNAVQTNQFLLQYAALANG